MAFEPGIDNPIHYRIYQKQLSTSLASLLLYEQEIQSFTDNQAVKNKYVPKLLKRRKKAVEAPSGEPESKVCL